MSYEMADEQADLQAERYQARRDEEDDPELEGHCESCGCEVKDMPCGCVCVHSFGVDEEE